MFDYFFSFFLFCLTIFANFSQITTFAQIATFTSFATHTTFSTFTSLSDLYFGNLWFKYNSFLAKVTI